MERVQPIRSPTDIEAVKSILKGRSQRDYILFLIGINSALRVGDLLSLTVEDVLNNTGSGLKTHITIREEKTGKERRFKLPDGIRAELAEYVRSLPLSSPLFPSRKGNQPITTVQAWRIIKDAAATCGISEIGTHSMRKSWAYHAYQRTKDIAVVQKTLNHSSPSITKRYLGIEDDEIEKALEGFEL